MPVRCPCMKEHRPELEGIDPIVLLAAPLALVTVLVIVLRVLT
jgi:hypothetical protein